MKAWPGFGAPGIGAKLTLAFAALAGMTFVVVALAWGAGQRVTDDIELSEVVRRPASLACARAQADLLRMQLHVRGYLVLSDPADIEQYRAARKSFEAEMAALQSMSNQWPEAEDARAVRALVDGYRAWAELPQQLFELHDSPLKNRPALRLARVEVQTRLVRILDAVDGIVERQKLREGDVRSRELLADLLNFQTSFDAMATNLMAYGASGEVNFKLTYGPQLATNAAAWKALSARRGQLDARQRELLEVIARNRAEVTDLALRIVSVVSGERAYEDLYLYRTQVAPQADVLLGRLADLTDRQQAQLGSSLAHARTGLSSVKVGAAVAGVVAVVIAVAMAYVFRRRVVLPLHRLTRVAERVTAGDLEARAEVESSDEVGVLAHGINTMTARLSETIRHLESIFAEAQDAKAAAEVANRAKSRFLASMSHELRTPLNAVLGYAQILLSEPGLSEFQVNRLDKIRTGGEHLLAMINDVLDLSRIEAGKLDLQPLPMRLSGLLGALCGAIRAAAERKGLSFASDVDPDLPAAVQVDGKRLEQVLLNLLDNAVKFTDHGQVSLRLRRLESTDAARACIRFEVADSGVGMAPAQLAALFRPFEQGDDSRRLHGGTGLGLAISQRIVAMMGGNIEVESRPGAGSLFRFQIDVALADADAAVVPRRGGADPAAVWRRILLVEAAPPRDADLAERLQACGFELAFADGAASAVAKARRQVPDLILVDARMPPAQAFAAIRRLREDALLRGIALIALSPTAAAHELADSGADAVLPLPLDVAVFAATIGELRQRRSAGAGPSAPAEPAPDASPAWVVPGTEELELLHELARIGNMRSIGERADHLAGVNPDYQPFARRLRDLAQRFQSRAILEWISELRSAGAGDVTPPVRGPTLGL
ncbi:MAG: HAMP domain-containing protein [Burkholderiales bacterium]|nr:HAMP domain-containing protein [Burkholderiales bacterium]